LLANSGKTKQNLPAVTAHVRAFVPNASRLCGHMNNAIGGVGDLPKLQVDSR
jgi:hypothetical protein